MVGMRPTHPGGLLKIERVLAELRKERKKIDDAIAALQPLVHKGRRQKRYSTARLGRGSLLEEVRARRKSEKGKDNAKIIQFPSTSHRAGVGKMVRKKTGRILQLNDKSDAAEV